MPIDSSWSFSFMRWSSNNYYQESDLSWKCIHHCTFRSLQLTWKWMSPLLGRILSFGLFVLLYWSYRTWFSEFVAVMFYRTILMTYKHKTHAVDSDGKITSNADVDFYIDDVCQLAVFPFFIFVVYFWGHLFHCIFFWL